MNLKSSKFPLMICYDPKAFLFI